MCKFVDSQNLLANAIQRANFKGFGAGMVCGERNVICTVECSGPSEDNSIAEPRDNGPNTNARYTNNAHQSDESLGKGRQDPKGSVT